jgi:hypothetical protein
MTERRTNRGQLVDFDKLLSRQGNAPALGNMRVDGKGNQVEDGKVVKSSDQRVRDHYRSVETTTETVSLRRERPKKADDRVERERARIQDRLRETAKKSTANSAKPKPTGQKEIHHDDGSIEVVPTYDGSKESDDQE